MATGLCTVRKTKPCFHQVKVIDDIHFIQCIYCEKPISHPITARFINHVSKDSLSRLAVTLIQKGQFDPAESTLADHIMEEI